MDMSRFFRPEHRKEVKAALNRAKLFFKHAKEDPEESLDFDPVVNKWFLFDCVVSFGQMCEEGKGFSMPMAAFRAYFDFEHPELLKEDYRDQIHEKFPSLQNCPKSEWLRMIYSTMKTSANG